MYNKTSYLRHFSPLSSLWRIGSIIEYMPWVGPKEELMTDTHNNVSDFAEVQINEVVLLFRTGLRLG